jgi:putative acetyltransferase
MSDESKIMVDIRAEHSEDTPEIRALVAAAFGPDSDTPDFVEAVRAQAEVCLAEVATRAGAIVGHAQWCAAPLVVDGRMVKGAYLTCLSVEPSLHRRGIGSRLVRGGLARLLERGYAAAMLLGDPAYYGRFGFSPELAERIEAPHRSRGRGFQAIELVPDVLAGRVRSAFPAVITPTEDASTVRRLVVRGHDDRNAFEDGPDRGRILVFGRDTGSAYGLMEWTVAPTPPCDGPQTYGAHRHDGCEETFLVRSGRLDFLLGDEVITLGPGDFVRAAPGVRHGYANTSGEPVELLVSFHPGGLEELFLKYRTDGDRPAEGDGFMADAERLFGSSFDLD